MIRSASETAMIVMMRRRQQREPIRSMNDGINTSSTSILLFKMFVIFYVNKLIVYMRRVR